MFRLDAKWLGAAVGITLGGIALADLPRLPPALTFPQSSDSPGQVVFRHESHVDAKSSSCLACHPRLFSILGRSAEQRRDVITHAAMEKGQSCGACHGKQAFGFDDCNTCHSK
jgi:c(7)-type cytochrome triheme protein